MAFGTCPPNWLIDAWTRECRPTHAGAIVAGWFSWATEEVGDADADRINAVDVVRLVHRVRRRRWQPLEPTWPVKAIPSSTGRPSGG